MRWWAEETRTHPFLDWPGPLAFAHRGGAGDAPENTLPAFSRAVELGYTYLETDAHVTRDGVVYAFHDDALDRTTDGRGRIDSLDAAVVGAADAGHTFTPDGGRSYPWRGAGLRVPRMEELLTAWPHVRVNIDLKSDGVVAPLVALVRRLGVVDRVCIGSFDDARIARAGALGGPDLCLSAGPRAVARARLASWTRLPLRLAGIRALQVPVRGGGVTLVDARLLTAAHRAGMQVHVWTVDEAPEMERLLDLGVDGVMTDRPAVLREVLERRGQWVGASVDAARQAGVQPETVLPV